MFNRFPALRKRRNQRAGLLSGGEQQMLALGRALMANPKLLASDEPSLGLAPMLVISLWRFRSRRVWKTVAAAICCAIVVAIWFFSMLRMTGGWAMCSESMTRACCRSNRVEFSPF